MGDVIMAAPLLSAIKKAWPEAEIDWLVDPALGDLLTEHPDCKRLQLWDKAAWRELARRGRWFTLGRRILALRKKLRARQYDFCLEAQGLFRARLLARLSGAAHRVGLESAEPGACLLHQTVSRGANQRRVSSEYLALLADLGIKPEGFPLRLYTAPEARTGLAAQLSAAGLKAGAYALLVPFTTRPQKHWPAERWPELAAAIQEKWGLPSVIPGRMAEREAALELAGGRSFIQVWAGKTSLAETMVLVENCAFLVGVDTGLTHMGSAFNRPTVALFGATLPYVEPPAPASRILYHLQDCAPCRRRPTCEGRYDCMRAISVNEVIETLSALRGNPA